MDGVAVDPLAFANVFLNSMLLLLGGIACAYLTMSAFFRPRHSLVVFWVYFLLKMSVVALYDTLAFFGMVGPEALDFGEVLIALFGIFVYIVVYYTWDSSFVKIGLISVAADLLSGLAMALVFVVLALLRGGDLQFDYVGYIDIYSFIRPIGMVSLFWVLLQVAKPIGRELVEREYKHERVFLVLIFVGIVLAATARMTLAQGDDMRLFFGPLALSLFLIPAIAWYVAYEWRRVRRERAYLARSKAIMAQCDEALRNQSSFLAGSRTTLDGLRERITQVEAIGTREDLQHHLDELLLLCDQLRFGTYSDNPALDVVLLGYEHRFNEAGLETHYRISPLDCGGERVALAAQALLDWAFKAYERSAATVKWDKRAVGTASTVGFRAFRRANQLFLEVKLSIGEGRVPHMRTSDRLPTAGAVVNEWREGNTLGLRLLVEDVAA